MSCLPEYARGENMLPRRNIHELTESEQASLKAAIMGYVALPDVIDCHAEHHELHTSGFFFLIGHRLYIEGLEAFLRKKGELEPCELLPKWDPSHPNPEWRKIPKDFLTFTNPSVIPKKEETISDICAPLRPVIAFSFFPFKSPWLRWWRFPIPIQWPLMPWKSLYGFALSWTCHFAVHFLVGGSFAKIPLTSGTPLFWLWHACIDDLYYDWEQANPHQHMAMSSTGPNENSIPSDAPHAHH